MAGTGRPKRLARRVCSPAAGPASLVAGLLLVGSARSLDALVGAIPSSGTTFPKKQQVGFLHPIASHHHHHQHLHHHNNQKQVVVPRRSCVRRRGTGGGAGWLRLSATGGSDGGAENIDSSDLYADMRQRLEELRTLQSNLPLDHDEDNTAADNPHQNNRVSDPSLGGSGGGKEAIGGKVYSGQEMKKAYYEAFWRARNLHKETKLDATSQTDNGGSKTGPSTNPDSPPPASPPLPEAAQQKQQQLPSHTTMLTPMTMKMVLSSPAALAKAATSSEEEAAAVAASSEVQGLTQMYYLEEEAEKKAVLSAAERAVVAGDGVVERKGSSLFSLGSDRAQAAAVAGAAPSLPQEAAVPVFAASDASPSSSKIDLLEKERVFDDLARPQGMSQMFFLDREEEEAAAAALPAVAGRPSFLSDKLGVPGEVVQGLRQVELDHARLAMLAVLLSGVVGAGVPVGASFANTQAGFSALAEVARTPWLDPCVAGVILSFKALSEGDWRLGKGALAGWADQALQVVADGGAKILRLGSGDEIRRLAAEIEVKHGRLALGAVVCAMAQQGIVTVGA